MDNILVINPGSTSTKLAIFSNHQLKAEETIRHSVEDISQFENVISQTDFRTNLISEFIKKHQVEHHLVAVVGRGGLLKPIPGGTYMVNDALLDDLISEKYNTHASNLGAILANEFSKKYDIPAYIVDPVVVDEMEPIAKVSGLKGITRRSVTHALNQKAVARVTAEELGKEYETSSMIVAHLGGGISVGAHKNGKMIDAVNGLDGEGPFSPERSGELPLIDFAHMIINDNLSLPEVKKIIAGNSGLKSYLGETDLREVEKRIENGDTEAAFYEEAMSYQVAKSIAEMSAVLKGQVDSIVLTGGAVYSKVIREQITSRVDWIAPVRAFPGEMEMQALYEGAWRVLNGKETAKDYALV